MTKREARIQALEALQAGANAAAISNEVCPKLQEAFTTLAAEMARRAQKVRDIQIRAKHNKGKKRDQSGWMKSDGTIIPQSKKR